MAIHDPLGETRRRNEMAAKAAERRRAEKANEWSLDGISDMERQDAEFNRWLEELSRLKDRLLP